MSHGRTQRATLDLSLAREKHQHAAPRQLAVDPRSLPRGGIAVLRERRRPAQASFTLHMSRDLPAAAPVEVHCDGILPSWHFEHRRRRREQARVVGENTHIQRG